MFEGGILQPWVTALVHHDDLAEVTRAVPVGQLPVESGGHGFAAGADDEDELLEVIRGDVGGGAGDEVQWVGLRGDYPQDDGWGRGGKNPIRSPRPLAPVRRPQMRSDPHGPPSASPLGAG